MHGRRGQVHVTRTSRNLSECLCCKIQQWLALGCGSHSNKNEGSPHISSKKTEMTDSEGCIQRILHTYNIRRPEKITIP